MRQPKMFLDVEMDIKWKRSNGEYRIIETIDGQIAVQKLETRTMGHWWWKRKATAWCYCNRFGDAIAPHLCGSRYDSPAAAKAAIERFERPSPKVLYP